MAFESNASTKAQKSLLEEVMATLDDPEFTDGSLTFGKGQNVSLVIDGETQEFPSYTALRNHLVGGDEEGDSEEEGSDNPSSFSDWADATRAQLGQLEVEGLDASDVDDDDLRPLFKGGSTPAEAAEEFGRRHEAEVAKIRAAHEKERQQQEAIKRATTALEAEVKALTKVVRGERSGELQKNEARYAKGEHLVNMENIGEELKAAGHPRFKSHRAVLAFAREQVNEAIAGQGVIDTALEKRLADQEVSAARTVYRTFMHKGLSTTFRLVDTIDPATGMPYQNDAGEPPEMPLTGIAMNKLYLLAKVYNSEDHDQIVSFAHRTGEKAISAVRKLMDAEKDNAAEVIEEVTEWLGSNPVKPDGEPYNSTDEALIDYVAQRTGKAAPSQVKTIKVDAGWFESFWRPMKEVSTALFKERGWVLDEKGEAPNTQILERMYVAAFSDWEDGEDAQVRGIINLWVDAGDVSEEEAEKFLSMYLSEEEEEEGEEGEGEEEATSEQEPVQA